MPATVERMMRLRQLHQEQIRGMMEWTWRIRDLEEQLKKAVAKRSEYAEDAKGATMAACHTILRMEPGDGQAIPD